VIPAAPLAQAIARSLPRFAYGASTQGAQLLETVTYRTYGTGETHPATAKHMRAMADAHNARVSSSGIAVAARDAVEEIKLRAAADAMWRKVEELS
jgi:hypothetical protein